MSRPEHQAPPEIYYGDTEARKYTANTRNQEIQAEMTLRAIELLALPEHRKPGLVLDVGCGSGLSGEILTELGYEWVGVDISPSMLSVALERDVEGDLLLGDAGHGCMFRPGSFDGAISVSVLQWLCNADTSYNMPGARLSTFFSTLYACLTRGARCVFQFYPENDDQVAFIMSMATKAGFGGGLVVDYPNSVKAKKMYLILWVGGEMMAGPNGEMKGVRQQLPQALDFGGPAETQVRNSSRKAADAGRERFAKRKQGETAKQYIQRKKELDRARGKRHVPHDSKYSGKKRRRK
ncbi:18S rRNA (guanine(1575)-N(7))-methyltransferase [Malassezia sp. CBS 17886]|nr:18S rRNA (guanine(1575)-N(7))-methyltransferase [Malassezia sp. CBS 17886]